MTSPTVALPPMSSTPGVPPASKSRATRSTRFDTIRAIDRSGMYSANGTVCRLTYMPWGPLCRPASGSQPMPAVQAGGGAGRDGERGEDDGGGTEDGGTDGENGGRASAEG